MRPFNLEEYLKDTSKKVVTRNGREARIICTNKKGICPVVALVASNMEGVEAENCWSYDNKGRKIGILKSEDDLFFVSEKKEGWINIYKNFWVGTQIYHSEEDALNSRDTYDYVTTIKIAWEE